MIVRKIEVILGYLNEIDWVKLRLMDYLRNFKWNKRINKNFSKIWNNIIILLCM